MPKPSSAAMLGRMVQSEKIWLVWVPTVAVAPMTVKNWRGRWGSILSMLAAYESPTATEGVCGVGVPLSQTQRSRTRLPDQGPAAPPDVIGAVAGGEVTLNEAAKWYDEAGEDENPGPCARAGPAAV